MRPIATLWKALRACGAIAVNTLNYNVFANMTRVVTIGSIDSHCGVAATGSPIVFVNGIPACGIGDINSGCPCPYPSHPPNPFVTGDYNVVIT